MDKQKVAENLVRIKALQDALKNEMDVLRSYIKTGEKIETAIGSIHMVDTSRTSYDEAGLLKELNKLGINPSQVGDLVVKVDKKKFASAIQKGEIPASLLEDFSETKQIDQLRIKTFIGEGEASQLQKETMERVASVLQK